MQSIWKKVGAALGSAVMIGATLAGAALAAETSDLGDYNDLIVDADGGVTGMIVVGANAATADVVSAIDMGAYIGQNVLKAGSGEGGVTLTPVSTDVSGVKRHVELDLAAGASNAYEFGSVSNDTIGATGFASGDGVVDYLFSYKDKGVIYYSNEEFNWHEEVFIDNTKIKALRDNKDTNEGDKYDEVFLEVSGNALEYRLKWDSNINGTVLKGKKLWFMGKEYTLISGTTADGKPKLGASDAEVVLSTADPTTTIGGVDVTLGGIYSTGTGNTYKAKTTVTNGGTTETKYITAGATDTVAGIEVYVKNAVVTTSGTNEGEAQMVVGAGILKLEDGSYLKLGDGTETTWQVDLTTTGTGSSEKWTQWTAKDTEPHTTVSSTNTVLYPGDGMTSPNNLFGLTYNGLTDKYGSAPALLDVDIMPTTRDLDKDGTAQAVLRVRTPGGDYITYTTSAGTSKITNELWINTTEVTSSSRFYYRDTTATSLTYERVSGTPYVKLSTSNTANMYYNNMTATLSGCGYFSIREPALAKDTNNVNITVEYNASGASSVGQFEDIDGASGDYYVYYDEYGSTDSADFIADGTSGATPATRDYYTKWGSYVDSVGSTIVSLQMPQEQLWGEYIVGTQAEMEGTAVSANAGETVSILNGQVKVEGSVGGVTKATLPTSVAKLDSDVSAADKSGYNLVLVGGPAVNTLVNALQTAGKLTKTIGAAGSTADIAAAGAGVVELVADAFATGKYAVVVAGSDRAGTAKAAAVLAHFDTNAATLDGKTVYEV